MSEYQYYEFQTIDRPLTSAEQAEVGGLSSHIDVSASRAWVSYNWGDFKHDFSTVVARYFDAGLYTANWGTRRLIFRFPPGAVDREIIAPYCSDQMWLETADGHDLLEMTWDEEGGGGWAQAEDVLSGLLPLRNDILEGDYRSLYLVWLKTATMFLDDEDLEPPAPAGLGQLSPALQALMDFFEIDEDWVAAAAQVSPPSGAGISEHAQPKAITGLKRAECDDWLLRLAQAEPGLGPAFRQQLRRALGPTPRPAAAARRSVAELRNAAEGRNAEAERQRREAAEQERIARLQQLAGQEALAWQSAETWIQRGQARAYEDAVNQLRQLRELAEYQGAQPEFQRRLRELRAKYQSRHSLLRRLDEAGLTG